MKLNDTTALMTAAILAALAICMLACGCSSADVPCTNPGAPVGTWSATVRGRAESLTLRADQTFAETRQGEQLRGTWSADASNITFVLSEGSTDAPQPYWVVGDELVIGSTYWAAECGDAQ